MIRISTTANAMSSKMWMNPPKVYELTIPSAHKTSRITKIVHSIGASFSVDLSIPVVPLERGDHKRPVRAKMTMTTSTTPMTPLGA
jgi:hypothetical protein